MKNKGDKSEKGRLPSHPHDMLFKAVFKNIDRAIEVLKVTLPATILAVLKLATLRIDDNSYVDERLAEFIADICFLCDNIDGDPVQLSMILEH